MNKGMEAVLSLPLKLKISHSNLMPHDLVLKSLDLTDVYPNGDLVLYEALGYGSHYDVFTPEEREEDIYVNEILIKDKNLFKILNPLQWVEDAFRMYGKKSYLNSEGKGVDFENHGFDLYMKLGRLTTYLVQGILQAQVHHYNTSWVKFELTDVNNVLEYRLIVKVKPEGEIQEIDLEYTDAGELSFSERGGYYVNTGDTDFYTVRMNFD